MAKKLSPASSVEEVSNKTITIPEVVTRAKHSAFAEGKIKAIDPQGDDEIKDRYDVVFLVDATDTNPNGDPDCGGAPRFDPMDERIFMTDCSIKDKIRRGITEFLYQELIHDRYAVCKEDQMRKVNPTLYELSCSTKEKKSPLTSIRDLATARARLKDVLCDAYTDVRMFGETLANNAGAIHGPVVFKTKIKSAVPSFVSDFTITSRLVNNDKGKERTMGSRSTNSYDVFPVSFSVNAHSARLTGMNMDDLNNLLDIIPKIFDLTNSSTRNLVFREMYVFKTRGTIRGNSIRTTEAFIKSIKVKDGIETPRQYEDIEYTVPNVPGVEVTHYDDCGNIVK